MKPKTPIARLARNSRAATSAVDSLRTHEKMAALVPAAMRLAALNQACTNVLPSLLGNCQVLRHESGQLVLAVPNASLATRLKTQIPSLQDALNASGWQINAIRLKVQPEKTIVKSTRSVKNPLPNAALAAFEELERSLGKAPGNEHLRAAVATLLQRAR